MNLREAIKRDEKRKTMNDSLQMKLSRVLFAELPDLLRSDVKASATAAADLSNLLGCVMATVLMKQPEKYTEAMRAVLERIHDSACKTAQKALTIDANITVQ